MGSCFGIIAAILTSFHDYYYYSIGIYIGFLAVMSPIMTWILYFSDDESNSCCLCFKPWIYHQNHNVLFMMPHQYPYPYPQPSTMYPQSDPLLSLPNYHSHQNQYPHPNYCLPQSYQIN